MPGAQFLSALVLVLPTLALGASIPITRSESATAAPEASPAPLDGAEAWNGTVAENNATVSNLTVMNTVAVPTNETASLLENASAPSGEVTSENVEEILKGYDLALLAYEDGTAYIVDKDAQVVCTGVDECKGYLESVGVDEIDCDEGDTEEEECTEEGEIPETPEIPEIPEQPNGPDGADSPDTPDTPDTPDSPDTPDTGKLGNVNLATGTGDKSQSGNASNGQAQGNTGDKAQANAANPAQAPASNQEEGCSVSFSVQRHERTHERVLTLGFDFRVPPLL